ncbi:MAG: FapA family protein, partial [Planctomycetes bacterium]|nr:FapA family protein [Planctomycetota bacterium]
IFEHVEIASTGKPMVPGKNAWLEWCIETEPQIEEDSQGRVDFYSFSALKNVNANQLIARVHPPEPGSDGLAVTGEPMPAVPVTDIAYAPGENVEYDETNHEFFSKIAGRVEVKGTVISVLRLFEVAGDVDFSVGNVQFDGLVKVRGNIKDNFNIAATDGVEVDGVIEGAHVKSNRNVVAMGGINLREKGSINCEGEIITKFLNNSTVFAKGAVKVEKEIMNCQVISGAVDAPQSQIAGGEIIAVKNIDIKEAGSQMGVRTVLHAGRNYFLEQDVKHLQEELDLSKKRVLELESSMKIAQPLMAKLSEVKRQGVTKIMDRTGQLKARVAKLEAEIEEKKKQVHSNDAAITIRAAVHPGVCIRIGRYEKTLTKQFDGYRRFEFDKNKYDIVAYFSEEEGKKDAKK